MPGLVYHFGASATCPHGGQVAVIPSAPRVFVSGQPVATMADTYLIAGCPFVLPGGAPSPCLTVRWLVPAARVLVGGVPAIVQTSSGLCLSPAQAPQGPPIIGATQLRVVGQ
jgi:hypothetical protein